MYIIRGTLFGYFTASSYLCPFFLAILLVQVPMPSIIAPAMFFVGNADIFTDPFRSPTLPLFVVVAFGMRHAFWRCVGKAISAKFFAMRTVCGVDVFLIRISYDASPSAKFAAISWRRTTW